MTHVQYLRTPYIFSYSLGTGLLNGRSEQLLGQFIAEAGAKAQYPVQVASKFAAYPWRLTAGVTA